MTEIEQILVVSLVFGLLVGVFILLGMWCKDYLDWVED